MNQFGAAVVVISAVFLAVATVFVALRLVSRIFLARKITLSDYVMFVGWALVCAVSGAIFYATANGLGLREGVRPDWRQPLAKAEYTFTVLYLIESSNPALTAVKSSILIFYLTLSKGHSLFRLGTYLTLGLVNVAGLVLTLVNVVQCRPVAAVVHVPTPPGAQCIDIVALYLSTAPVNIVTDIAIFFLPMPTLWRMRLPKKQKIILLLVFGTGLFVTVISVIRTVSLLHAAIARVTSLHPPGVHDLLYYDGFLFMWSAIELNLGIICGCVPKDEGLRPQRVAVPMPPLTMEEVERRIFAAKSWKAPGDDGLPAMVWKQVWPVVKDRVLLLFQTSLEEGELPTQWRNAKIIPLKKPNKGDYTVAKAWRPISLLATLGKTLESVVAERISHAVETFGLLPANHFGARKKRSAEQALLLLQEHIYNACDFRAWTNYARHQHYY